MSPHIGVGRYKNICVSRLDWFVKNNASVRSVDENVLGSFIENERCFVFLLCELWKINVFKLWITQQDLSNFSYLISRATGIKVKFYIIWGISHLIIIIIIIKNNVYSAM